MKNKKILILGDARHGKDTVAEILSKHFGLTHLSSSVAALRIFLYDTLRDKYGLQYESYSRAYDDRVNHRDKWFNEICEYNKEDPTRLTKKILENADIYVGLRDYREVEKAIEENIFDHIIGVYDYRKPRESSDSNTADVFKYSDIVLMNNGSLRDLENKILRYFKYDNEDWTKEYIRTLPRIENNDLLTIEYIMEKHPRIGGIRAKDLLDFCKDNSITHKGCYGDGSIMYPKWVKSLQ